MSLGRRRLRSFLLFTVLTVLMTYPLALHLGTHLGDRGDSLLNSWIMSWEIHKIARLDFSHYFDANIFYPHARTLAFSEFLFPQALVALPVQIISGNPVLAYNIVFLLALILTGWGMAELVRHLVKDEFAAHIAGFIFAFSPFMLDHYCHIQVISAGGIPLALLALHKFFENGKTRDLVTFAIFYIIQFLANGYYGLYLTLFAGLLVIAWTAAKKLYLKPKFWEQAVLAAVIAAAGVGPFVYQYFRLKSDMGFIRPSVLSTPVSGFLAAPSINRLYGKITAGFGQGEARLFPGLAAFILAVLGVVLTWRFIRRQVGLQNKHPWTYAVIGLLAALFSLGGGFYMILYKFVPGFDGLRVPARFHIFTMVAIAVLAGFGVRGLRTAFPKYRLVFALLIPIILALEYVSVPLPRAAVPQKKDLPPIYTWLAVQNQKNLAVLELPLPSRIEDTALVETLRMYYSIFHWTKMVNGFSGYIPPLYSELCSRWNNLELAQNVDDLIRLNVNLILAHREPLTDGDIKLIEAKSKTSLGELQFVTSIGDCYVFAVKPNPSRPEPPATIPVLRPMSRTGWTADASVNPDKARLAIDGDPATRWESGPQKPGTTFTLDLHKSVSVRRVSLRFGRSPSDYPRGYIAEISSDGKTWERVGGQSPTILPITTYLDPKNLSLDIVFGPRTIRWLRVTSTAEDPVIYWSVHEIDVYGE